MVGRKIVPGKYEIFFRLKSKSYRLNVFFQEARRIVSAIQQHISWNEFLPRVLGWNAINLYELGLEQDGYYRGYDDKCNPTILNEFATAAFRFGHSLIKPTFKRMDDRYSERVINIQLKCHLILLFTWSNLISG